MMLILYADAAEIRASLKLAEQGDQISPARMPLLIEAIRSVMYCKLCTDMSIPPAGSLVRKRWCRKAWS